jgi:carbonic anhydrase/acetyltransferase-like protein (isoleucine patch superfamily)
MVIKHRGFDPLVEASVFVAPTAVLVGRVSVGPKSRIMYGAVLDSEGSRIEVGECTIVCENAVLRATASGDGDHPVIIGDHVFVSPHATLLGCTVEPCSYIATGATVLQGSTVQTGGVIAVGALVHANTNVPSGFFVPPNTIAIGDPVRVYGPDEKEALAQAIKSVEFSRVAFGVLARWEDRESRYKQATEIRSREFESHFEDVILSGPFTYHPHGE